MSEYCESEDSARIGLSRSTGGIVDPIYLGGDLDYGGLQRDDGPVERRDVCVESLHLGDGIEAMHGLIKSGRRWLPTADSQYGADSILKRSDLWIVSRNLHT